MATPEMSSSRKKSPWISLPNKKYRYAETTQKNTSDLGTFEKSKPSRTKISKRKVFKRFLRKKQEPSMLQHNSIDVKSLRNHAILGRGGFGTVCLVSQKIQDGTTERYFAQKRILKASIVKHKQQTCVLMEKQALQAMYGCPFIMKLMGTFQDAHSIYFLTEFVQGGTLQDYINKNAFLSEACCQLYSASIALALVHMHRMGFFHRDVKPENCLISSDGYLKLCDFGIAKRLQWSYFHSGGIGGILAYTMCGTPQFMAPEVVLCYKLKKGYGKEVDWWALGCILLEMYTGRRAVRGRTRTTVYIALAKIGVGTRILRVPDEVIKARNMYGKEASSIISQLLRKQSTRLGRESSSDVLKHEYFVKMGISSIQSKRLSRVPYIPRTNHASDTQHYPDIYESESDTPKPFSGDTRWCRHF